MLLGPLPAAARASAIPGEAGQGLAANADLTKRAVYCKLDHEFRYYPDKMYFDPICFHGRYGFVANDSSLVLGKGSRNTMRLSPARRPSKPVNMDWDEARYYFRKTGMG